MKKGFTLIELLAVIVILAIISLIAIPIILNIIEDARKSSIADSAYGYKDAITKFFASELISDSDFEIEDITYTVSNGSLQYIDSQDSNNNVTYNIKMNGKKPNSGSVEVINKIVVNACLEYNNYAVTIVNGTVDQVVTGSCDGLVISDGSFETEVYDFDYVQNGTTKEQTLNITKSGYYRLEVWGAQGGTYSDTYYGGYGGYSTGTIYLTSGTTLFINVGGKGTSGLTGTLAGGYNGGGNGYGGNCNGGSNRYGASGGGATHIALHTGLLSSFDTNGNNIVDDEVMDDLLIVAGGGGGSHYMNSAYGSGAAGGGYIGNTATWTNSGHSYYVQPTGGTQSSGGSIGYSYATRTITYAAFGQGQNYPGKNCSEGSGGGGGYYGGGSGAFTPGGGGSGYIGNNSLGNKSMTCYKCLTSNTTGTKTFSTTDASTDPISYYAKKDNGHARITYIGSSSNSVGNNYKMYFGYTGSEQELSVNKAGYYKLEVWGAQGGSYNNNYQGGYGGYSQGTILLQAGQTLHINVGGSSTCVSGSKLIATGGYNGGGNAYTYTSSQTGCGGGGATSIALESGILAELSDYKGELDDTVGVYRSNKILIVTGGGSGAYKYTYGQYSGQAGGGASGRYTSQASNAGNQTTGWQFGSSNMTEAYAAVNSGDVNYSGGGGGFFGGHPKWDNLSGGGSGYIGNSLLTNKSMFCYGCNEDNNTETKTISTTGSSNLRNTTTCNSGYSSNPIDRCAKLGNGYAVITYLGASVN